jgi:hypothetical protein
MKSRTISGRVGLNFIGCLGIIRLNKPEVYLNTSLIQPHFDYPSLSILLANPVLKANCVGKERRAG